MSEHKLSLEQEQQLVERAQNDDWAAFEKLYNQYFKEIFHYLMGRLGNKELAEDICSETFLKAVENIKKFQWKGVPFRAWLYRIAINCANQAYKKDKRVSNVDIEIIAQIPEEETLSTAEKIDKEKDNTQLMKALEKIPPKEQTIISLRYFQDMSYEEIAEITGDNSNAVGVKIHRILKKLHSYI